MGKTKAIAEVVNTEVREEIARPYKLRALRDGDLMPILKLLRKIGLKNFKDAVQQAANGAKLEEIGIVAILNVADVIIGNLELAENEIYEFWGDMSGIPVDEIKMMEFGTLPLMIYDTFMNAKNVPFFKVAFKLL